MVSKDFEAAYAMSSPASRSVMSLEAFRRKASLVTWKSASLGKVECPAEDLCKLRVEARYAYQLKAVGRHREVENTQVVEEVWRNVDGGWWYVLSDQ